MRIITFGDSWTEGHGVEEDEKYKETILSGEIKIAIEAGIGVYFDKYIGKNGKFFGVESFGESGSKNDLYKHFNLTADYIFNEILKLI